VLLVAAILGIEVLDSSKALAPVPESATVITPVATAAVLVTLKVCAAGAAVYPTVAPANVCVPVGDSEIAGTIAAVVVTGAVTVKLTFAVRETSPPVPLTVTVAV